MNDPPTNFLNSDVFDNPGEWFDYSPRFNSQGCPHSADARNRSNGSGTRYACGEVFVISKSFAAVLPHAGSVLSSKGSWIEEAIFALIRLAEHQRHRAVSPRRTFFVVQLAQISK